MAKVGRLAILMALDATKFHDHAILPWFPRRFRRADVCMWRVAINRPLFRFCYLRLLQPAL